MNPKLVGTIFAAFVAVLAISTCSIKAGQPSAAPTMVQPRGLQAWCDRYASGKVVGNPPITFDQSGEFTRYCGDETFVSRAWIRTR